MKRFANYRPTVENIRRLHRLISENLGGGGSGGGTSNASDISSGTLSDDRLSSNVALKSYVNENIQNLIDQLPTETVVELGWLKNPGNPSFRSQDLAVIAMIEDIVIEYPEDHKDDVFAIGVFTKAGGFPGFDQAIMLVNKTTDVYAGRNLTNAEVTAGYAELSLSAIAGFEGRVAKVTFDWSKSQSAGDLIVSADVDHFIEINLSRQGTGTSAGGINISLKNPWYGKTICWPSGTSIAANWTPDFQYEEQNSYPHKLGQMLGANVKNNSIASLQLHLNANGTIWEAGSSVAYLSEYSNPAKNPSGVGYTSGLERFRSFENSLLNQNADLYVFDVVPNNTNFDLTEFNKFNFDTLTFSDNSSFDANRKTFLGCLLFMVNKLYTENPKARIVFITTFAQDNIGVTQVDTLAAKLHVRQIKLREGLGDNAWTRSTLMVDALHPTHDWGTTQYAKALFGEFLRL